jgi:hypothetical protein
MEGGNDSRGVERVKYKVLLINEQLNSLGVNGDTR